jgi:guanosine-3',5'-bis(diphosphate) 3'-pyrophosphohydrolase
MMTFASTEAMLFSVLAFAAAKHRDQRRKDAEASPYINHPIALARILTVEGGVTDPATLGAAILHDTIEDTLTTADELRELFGEEVTAVVLEVTDDKDRLKADRKRLQVDHAPHLSTRAKLVKLADKISNIRDVASNPPTDWSMTRRQEYFEWAKQVVDGLRGVHPRLEAVFDEAYRASPTVGKPLTP